MLGAGMQVHAMGDISAPYSLLHCDFYTELKTGCQQTEKVIVELVNQRPKQYK